MSQNRISKNLQQWFNRWLDKRQPESKALRLHQGIIYILPSRFGCWFMFLTALLYLLGTNYQNNLILLVSFILLSMLLYAMHSAFFNLYRLQLSIEQDAETFAHTPAIFTLYLKKPQTQMLQIGLKGQRTTQLLPLLQHSHVFPLQIPLLSRGCYPLPRLLFSSRYPLGLFKAWSYPALSGQIWVFPTPEPAHNTGLAATLSAENHPLAEPQDPDSLKPYQSGDNLKRILWKKLPAAPQQPIVRQFAQQATALPNWVVVPALQGVALEQALSHACYALLQLEQQGACYGLQTSLTTLAPNSGKQHLTQCLQTLALC